MHGFNASRAKRFALGRLPAGQMNKLEARYAEYLKAQEIAGDVLWWKFEPVRLVLAPRTTYTPDFLTMLADETLEFVEVKGHWQDDARCKIKVAAATLPFRFVAVKPLPKKDGGGWKREEF